MIVAAQAYAFADRIPKKGVWGAHPTHLFFGHFLFKAE